MNSASFSLKEKPVSRLTLAHTEKKENPNRAKQIMHGRRVQGEGGCDGEEVEEYCRNRQYSVADVSGMAEFIVASPLSFTPILETGSDLVK